MKILRFYADWCSKCKKFSGREKLGYDADVNVDLPSHKKTLVKYQISIIPTFVAISENGKVKGKLTNPSDIDEYFEWKDRLIK